MSSIFRACYAVISDVPTQLVIRDIGEHCRSVTNDAEHVVAELIDAGRLTAGKQLLYYDSDGRLDELCHDGRQFTGFKFGGKVVGK